MQPLAESPFREDDPAARLAALCDKRDALRADLAKVETEIARHRPWRWGRFFLGLVLLPGAIAVVVIARL
ncbi:MAG TPA: hypothetical protein VF765_28405 [Polyangiaceae bacterium]